ncbi:glycosyltransferase family 4 protein [Erythrobacter insulae]|uniref:Glycosyltransferase family 4 protein n=1 Tax=Erythrobacter insulae TaxID=2584124 RepID=A0A547PBA1_9SPHN|nr:glycosyltransferase family 4 protein [Erythrobacter insulae]TRD11411.1 glycosyltransferase family 4 protein [Erythrobacter insulae]
MKIAYIFDPANLHSTTYSGVVRQGLTWASGLLAEGVTVEFPVAHETFDWSTCDLVHVFQYGSWAEAIIEAVKRYDIPVVLSPIVDRSTPYGWRGRLIAKTPFERLGLRQRHRTLSNLMQGCDRVLARSELEKRSLSDVSSDPSNIDIVRIGIDCRPDLLGAKVEKSPHVFHMSHLNQERKNVKALIEVCENSNVPLRLAGKVSDAAFSAWLDAKCRENPKLEYIGTISEDQKWEEMGKASVFCLPSLNEGIGLVALEAYTAGAHIVLTNRTGGVEYFDGDIEICDPASNVDIARCVSTALSKPVHNGPRLEAMKAFSNEASVARLLEVYQILVPGHNETLVADTRS